MEDYKPNSNRFKEQQKQETETEKKVEKVVTGKVTTVKKSEASKIKSIFISDDAKNLKNYVFMDVLVPALKKALSDIVTNGIEMILYGESGSPDRRRNSASGRVSYGDCYRRDDRRSEPRTRTGYDYDDVVLDSRGEAEEVLSRMEDLIATYGMVSVADMYDLVGLSCNYTDNKYGWVNIRNAEAVRVRDGYMLKLPKAMPLN